MGKEADRIKRWRERQKAEGKASYTVLLSREARVILNTEKEKTGESYAVIIEKALQSLNMQVYRPPDLRHFPKRKEALTNATARDHHPPVSPVASNENGGQPKILIDDLANYPSIVDTPREQARNGQKVIYDLKSNEGLLARLLRFSEGSFNRKKKWFK